MIKQHLRLWAERSIFTNAVAFYLIDYSREGGLPSLATSITFEARPEGFRPERPTFSLLPEAAQEMFDALYAAGLRPSQPTEHHGALNAHLADMRAIAFAKLNIELPAGATNRRY